MDWTAPCQTASGIISLYIAPTCSSGTSNDNAVLGADDRNAVSGTVGTSNFVPFSGWHVFGGMNPGNTYTARLAIRSGTGGQTVTVGQPFTLQVTPQP
jgi:hypothetical protein